MHSNDKTCIPFSNSTVPIYIYLSLSRHQRLKWHHQKNKTPPKRCHLGWNGNNNEPGKLNSWNNYLFLLSMEINTMADNVLNLTCKLEVKINLISGEPFIHLSLIISCTASLTRKLKSRFILLLQNLLARPHVWAGKHGLLMPWKMRATALPLNLCSWPWRLISCRMSAMAWETSCGEGWNEMKTKDGSV